MYLKTIEIRGFKSFANKTKLIFKKGVTAIVGPNGSGKSNISDAIKWVLGEQSVKSLRGGKMEDVIFAGTQFRKPVSLAQVSLTLDNTDGDLPIEYSDVIVSRRIYRSGESEYFINNTRCRLKDIQELFMDTGIGKEGYSIIGQGKIDAILSGKPEERRSLLEEAAGIVKFKTRKESAEKKLKNTEENLIRINDILNTYEERLEPLRLQSDRAKEFLKYSEELKKKEINITVHFIESNEKDIKNISHKIQDLKSKSNTIIQKEEDFKNKLNNLNTNLDILESKTSEGKKEYYSKKEKLNNITNDIKILRERIKNFDDYISKAYENLDHTENKIKKIKQFKIDKETNLLDNKNKLEKINKFINDHKKEMDRFNKFIDEKLLKIKDLKEDQIDYLSKVSNINNEILMINNSINNFKTKISDIKGSSESYTNSIRINVDTSKKMEDELSKVKDKIGTYECKIKANKKEIIKIRSLLNNQENKFKELNNLYNKSEANFELLKNLDKQYEGYSNAVKNLMKDVHKGKVLHSHEGIFILGEIINVKKDLEISMEVSLGGAISNVITSKESVAKTLIRYLKINKLGRATFLPLNIIKPRNINIASTVKNMVGYIGIASNLIDVDCKFRKAIDYVLGRVIIAKDMDSALNIAKSINYSYRIVTLKGEVINPGGSLTGGSLFHKNNISVISRKRQIEELRVNISKVKESMLKINKSIINNKKAVSLLDEECLNLKDEIYYENIESTKTQQKLLSIKEENEKLKNKIFVSNNEIKGVTEKINESLTQKAEKENELDKLKILQEENEGSIEKLEKCLENNKKNIQQIQQNLTSYKINKAKLDEIVINYENELKRLKEEEKEIESNIDNVESSINNLQNDKKNCNETISKSNENIEIISKQLKDFEEQFETEKISFIKIKDKISKCNDHLQEIVIVKNKTQESLHKEEINLAKLEAGQKSLHEKLNEENGINYAEALDYKEDIENILDYKKHIQKIKQCISNLGTINVSAIEEYKEIREKFDFMNTQKEDLTKAKQELLNVIEEMTNKMRLIFKKNFNKLKELFNDTFKELFKGGNADLILNGKDELSGNIDITVQPPGKKLQNINLMSGGEKVLSAIALLFSILKMKPTPFCILDEIEAALDDANVIRYAEFLKKFSSKIQFIVITHRKGTMETSNVLYGVTMEERGVSKIVSVNLTNEERI